MSEVDEALKWAASGDKPYCAQGCCYSDIPTHGKVLAAEVRRLREALEKKDSLIYALFESQSRLSVAARRIADWATDGRKDPSFEWRLDDCVRQLRSVIAMKILRDDSRAALSSVSGTEGGAVSDKLKPCPHCGSEAVITSCPMDRTFAVECADRCLEAGTVRREAIAAWNRRVSPSPKAKEAK